MSSDTDHYMKGRLVCLLTLSNLELLCDIISSTTHFDMFQLFLNMKHNIPVIFNIGGSNCQVYIFFVLIVQLTVYVMLGGKTEQNKIYVALVATEIVVLKCMNI